MPSIRPLRFQQRRLPLAVALWAACLAAGPLNAADMAAVPSTPVGSGYASSRQIVRDGHARFEVLTPTLIRMEYAQDDRFQDGTTFNVVRRDFSPVPFTTSVVNGYREIRTAKLTLRYRQNSGPFTGANTSVQLASGAVTAHPAFPSYCVFATACQAEQGLAGGMAAPAYDHTGYAGSGFLAGFTATGSSLIQDVSAIPKQGTYQLTVRYANATGGDGQAATRTLSTRIDGVPGPSLSLPVTGSWDTWSTVSVNLPLDAGTHTLSIQQTANDSGNVNLDGFAITPVGAGYPDYQSGLLATGYGAGPSNALGGWDRSLDNPGTIPVPEHPGLLSRDGWYLLDDTRTALLNGDLGVSDRPAHGANAYQDGYFFGYGHDYKQGLADLNELTGKLKLLPRSAYGVWYSRYFAYTTADYETSLLPMFRSTSTPIDWLVVDTDWKSPSQWNGWNWNSALFPQPQSFLDWTRQQGLDVAMNIHTSIAGDDPQFAATNAQAGGLIPEQGNGNYDFDWSNPAHLKAYFDLHRPFEQQGVRAWWLDYCSGCGSSTASNPHLAPDNFINQAYAIRASWDQRGFSFGRIGGSQQGSILGNYPLGPWSERRNTLQFTGDTPASWDMLDFEARFTPDEAAAGLSNISHDIGSFHGNHLDDDLYVRWVQLGTFQPIDRLHSDHGDRLPWNYTGLARTAAEKFLQLREALVPYTYTLARQAHATGLPIARPLYLEYPEQDAAYSHPKEYLYGDGVLVAPITSPNDASGNGTVEAWIPPGTWTDYFTGTTYTGPATTTITASLLDMPVLLKAGGIMVTRTDYADNQHAPLDRLTVNVAAGADGSFSLYEDAGEGQGFQLGQYTDTPIRWRDGAQALTIGASQGFYVGAPALRAYTLRLFHASAPHAVKLDGRLLPRSAWSYDGATHTATVTTIRLPLRAAHTIALL